MSEAFSNNKELNSNLDQNIVGVKSSNLKNKISVELVQIIEENIINGSTENEKSYFTRIKKLLSLKDLTLEQGHPVQMIANKIKNASFYKGFEIIESPEIVSERETFDLFNFSKDHVARRPSDSYFIKKSSNPKNSLLLRPHTSVVWYEYFINQHGKQKLHDEGEIKILSSGKVYRVDTLDPTHHECFHQIDGLRIVEKTKELVTQETLKKVLIETIQAIFGPNIEYKFQQDSFPYTINSLEAYVKFNDQRIEVLGAGIVHPTVFSKLGIDPKQYNGWAYGFGIERLAMAMKKVPDIRIFWSEDSRITQQRGNFDEYKEVSRFPAVFKDISMIVPKSNFVQDTSQYSQKNDLSKETESSLFALANVARSVGGELVEKIEIIDMFENDVKFGAHNQSISIRITFRSLERTLNNDEINTLYFQIREKIETELQYTLR